MNGKNESFIPFSLNESELNVESSGEGWKIYSIPSQNAIDNLSLNVNPVAQKIKESVLLKSSNQFMLNTDVTSILPMGINKKGLGKSITLQPVDLSKDFTIEVIVMDITILKV